jgi:hypothetical protein
MHAMCAVEPVMSISVGAHNACMIFVRAAAADAAGPACPPGATGDGALRMIVKA